MLAPDFYLHQLQIEQDLNLMQKIADNMQALLSWFAGYILTLAGDNIPDRVAIYDMIVEGLEDCAKLNMHKSLSKIAGSMKRQIEKLLNFLPYLDQCFESLAQQHNNSINKDAHVRTITKSVLWQINKYLHYSPDNPKAIELATIIKRQIGKPLFEKMKHKIKNLHQATITCSSYAENHIGRIKPFIARSDVKLSQKRMDLLRLFINTSNVHSSRDYTKRSKTPLQLMLGEQFNQHWIDYFYDKPTIKLRGFTHPEIAKTAKNSSSGDKYINTPLKAA